MKNVLLFFVFIILSSCSSDNSPKKNENDTLTEMKLQGKWSWVSTTNGIDGTITTPVSTNTTVITVLKASKLKI